MPKLIAYEVPRPAVQRARGAQPLVIEQRRKEELRTEACAHAVAAQFLQCQYIVRTSRSHGSESGAAEQHVADASVDALRIVQQERAALQG